MQKQKLSKPELKSEIGFALFHLSPVLIFWTGATAFDWFVCIFLYFFRMFFITGGYHRYFSYKIFKTTRFFKITISFFADTSVQKDTLWRLTHHGTHHKYSDTTEDPYSSKIYGFWYSHIGWIRGSDFKETRFELIKDYSKFPELRWLNKHYLIPPLILMLSVYVIGGYVNAGGNLQEMPVAGLSTLVTGFFLSTVILFHCTFSINSLMHMIGKPRYERKDESKNSLILALVTLREGWHNKHHYYQSSVRQGFFWRKIDLTFYLLKILSWLGIAWDLRPVPAHIKYSKNKDKASLLARLGKFH